MSVSWTFVAIAIIVTVTVQVFVLENLHATDATFFSIHWRIPLGLDLLLAALLGAITVFVVGAARTFQLRLLTRRTMRARDTQAESAGQRTHRGAGPASTDQRRRILINENLFHEATSFALARSRL
jgi:uncharacterized integral membrane protein